MNLFCTHFKRTELLKYTKTLDYSHLQTLQIHIHRNHAFEPIASVIAPFLHYAGFNGEFVYGDYDESLSYANLRHSALSDFLEHKDSSDADFKVAESQVDSKNLESLGDSAAEQAIEDSSDSKICDEKGVFSSEPMPKALHIIFLDLHRYTLSQKALQEFLKERAQSLRALTNAPILLLLLEDDSTKGIAKNLKELESSDIFSFSIHALIHTYHTLSQAVNKAEQSHNEPSPLETQNNTHNTLRAKNTHALLDESKESISGTRLSNATCLTLAQILGLKLIPSLLLPSLKAIALDLDNTLYRGILGEEGIENLSLTPAHKALQEQILEFKKQGFLLALASKNEYEDAKKLFEIRDDFPLKWSDFDCKEVHWQGKEKSLQNIAKAFNIGLDSVLFIDDNIAELESSRFLGIKQIHAKSPQIVLLYLYLYPQMTRLRSNKEDSLRAQDLRANAERKSLESLNDTEYFQNLALGLTFHINPHKSAQRIYELLNKTNQFIANYTRPSLSSVQEWLDSKSHCVVTIEMKDRLSESGIIGIIVARNLSLDMQFPQSLECQKSKSAESKSPIPDSNDMTLKDKSPLPKIEILDLVVSCRALGRRLESIMLLTAFECAYNALLEKESSAPDSKNIESYAKQVLLHFQKGERNAPFLQTLQTLTKQNPNTQAKSAHIALTKPNTQGLTIHIIKEQR